MTNRLNSSALLLMMLAMWPTTAAGQSVSLKDTARALGGKASTMSDVDLPSAALPDLVKMADFIVEASILSKRGVLCFDESMVCTEYQILPTKTFKNRLALTTRRTPGPGVGIVVRQGGGRLVEDGLELESHNNLFPIEGLSVGRSFVMFLQHRPDDGHLWFVHGPYGAFALEGSSVLPSTKIAVRHAQTVPQDTAQLYAEIVRLLQQP